MRDKKKNILPLKSNDFSDKAEILNNFQYLRAASKAIFHMEPWSHIEVLVWSYLSSIYEGSLDV